MRVWAGALTEAACSVEAYLPLHRPLDDDGVLHDRCDVWRISLPGYLLRTLVRGSGCSWRGRSLYPPAASCATPLERPLSFALGAPEGVYLSAVGMPISPPLVRAACPRQNDEKC
jgi:hypothetical protein